MLRPPLCAATAERGDGGLRRGKAFRIRRPPFLSPHSAPQTTGRGRGRAPLQEVLLHTAVSFRPPLCTADSGKGWPENVPTQQISLHSAAPSFPLPLPLCAIESEERATPQEALAHTVVSFCPSSSLLRRRRRKGRRFRHNEPPVRGLPPSEPQSFYAADSGREWTGGFTHNEPPTIAAPALRRKWCEEEQRILPQ